MIATLLLLASTVVAADPVPDPAIERVVAESIRELTDTDARAREAAASALLKLGPAALPVLQAHLDKTKDPELRRRLEGIIQSLQKAGAGLKLTVEPIDKPVVLDPAGSLPLKIRLQNASKRPAIVCRLQGDLYARTRERIELKVLEFDSNGGVRGGGTQIIDNGETAVLHVFVRDQAGKDLLPLGVVGIRADRLREADFVTLPPGEETTFEVKLPIKDLVLPGPGSYELAVSYRLQGDGAPTGVSIDGKSKKLVDLLLSATRCDIAAKVKLEAIAR